MPGFNAAFAAGVFVAELATWFLLLVMFRQTRKTSVLVLANAYLFSADDGGGLHAVTFPGQSCRPCRDGLVADHLLVTTPGSRGFACSPSQPSSSRPGARPCRSLRCAAARSPAPPPAPHGGVRPRPDRGADDDRRPPADARGRAVLEPERRDQFRRRRPHRAWRRADPAGDEGAQRAPSSCGSRWRWRRSASATCSRPSAAGATRSAGTPAG